MSSLLPLLHSFLFIQPLSCSPERCSGGVHGYRLRITTPLTMFLSTSGSMGAFSLKPRRFGVRLPRLPITQSNVSWSVAVKMLKIRNLALAATEKLVYVRLKTVLGQHKVGDANVSSFTMFTTLHRALSFFKNT